MGKSKKNNYSKYDNLHQVSGVSSDKVIELHGNNTYAKCLSCKKRYEIEDKKRVFQTKHAQNAAYVEELLKQPQFLWPGNARKRDVDPKALECDLFAAIGSSLQVYQLQVFLY